MTAEWETINQISTSDTTQRMSVLGGWLVCRVNGIHLPQQMASWFVSDPEHSWVID
jgi:hypothetical protein